MSKELQEKYHNKYLTVAHNGGQESVVEELTDRLKEWKIEYEQARAYLSGHTYKDTADVEDLISEALSSHKKYAPEGLEEDCKEGAH